MPYVSKNCGSPNDGGLGMSLKCLVSMVKTTVENSAEYAVTLIKAGNYNDAKTFLKNALEGIEILEG